MQQFNDRADCLKLGDACSKTQSDTLGNKRIKSKQKKTICKVENGNVAN